MDHITSRVVLKQIAPNIPTVCGCFRCALRMEVRTVSAGETLLALDDIQTAGKAAHRQLRRQKSVIRRFACMQWLAHGPEHGLQAGRLSACNTKGRVELLSIQL